MSQSMNSANRSNQYGRYSSVSTDENSHSINSAALSLQTFVDDIPFQFNSKYQTIIVPNIDIPEFDTTKIRDILTRSVDFTLENKVLLEALEDLQRKKKEIEADTLRQQTASPSTVITTNGSIINSIPILSNTIPETISFPVNYTSLPVPPRPPPPPLQQQQQHIVSSQPTVSIPVVPSSFPVTPLPSTQPKPSISPSYRLPSVRDIYWPTTNQQQYAIPINNGPTTSTTNTLSLPTPIHSTHSSPNSNKTTDRSFNNCDPILANDLAATFDDTLGSDDPFHDAELKSLNDVAELRHLYSAIGSANTVRR